jgi:hypothetical protein
MQIVSCALIPASLHGAGKFTEDKLGRQCKPYSLAVRQFGSVDADHLAAIIGLQLCEQAM